MLRIIFGIFIILHGLVHLLYFGQAQRLFELQPKMTWPDNSWLFSRVFGSDIIRSLVSLFCLFSATGFVIGGLAFIFHNQWWNTGVTWASIISTLLFISCWNGEMNKLKDSGAIGIAINILFLTFILVFRWPV